MSIFAWLFFIISMFFIYFSGHNAPIIESYEECNKICIMDNEQFPCDCETINIKGKWKHDNLIYYLAPFWILMIIVMIANLEDLADERRKR